MPDMRALVVENDPFPPTSRVSAREYRRMRVAVSATSSREALDRQCEHLPDVALLDLDLGVGPTGIDLAHGLCVRQSRIGDVLLSSYRDPRSMAMEDCQPAARSGVPQQG